MNFKSSCCIAAAMFSGAYVSGHMPTYPTADKGGKPVDLGDLTENSWALATSIGPEEVHYYKFRAEDLTNGKPADEKFYIGLYVPPGVNEQDFTYYAAIWGMSEELNCKSNNHNKKVKKEGTRRLAGEGVHGHDGKGNALPYSRIKINDGDTILVGREAIPSYVKDLKD